MAKSQYLVRVITPIIHYKGNIVDSGTEEIISNYLSIQYHTNAISVRVLSSTASISCHPHDNHTECNVQYCFQGNFKFEINIETKLNMNFIKYDVGEKSSCTERINKGETIKLYPIIYCKISDYPHSKEFLEIIRKSYISITNITTDWERIRLILIASGDTKNCKDTFSKLPTEILLHIIKFVRINYKNEIKNYTTKNHWSEYFQLH